MIWLRHIKLFLVVASLAGNVLLWRLYTEALEDTGRLRAESQRDSALAANDRLTQSLSHQATAYEAQIAELQSRLQQSNEAAEHALDREQAAHQELEQFKAAQAADDSASGWETTKLPSSVVARLQELSGG